MGKRRPRRDRSGQQPAPSSPAPPFNNPFGALQGLRGDLAPGPEAEAPADPVPQAKASATSWGKLVVSAEKKGRAGKTVTRVVGLPVEQAPALAKQIKAALGCGATFEGQDLLLLGSLVERCVDWLEARGVRRVVVSGGGGRAPRRRRSSAERSSVPPRAELRAGQVVEIVLKQDQASGRLTRGVLQTILTRSATHPHGIKVRLEDGAVGRVKRRITPG